MLWRRTVNRPVCVLVLPFTTLLLTAPVLLLVASRRSGMAADSSLVRAVTALVRLPVVGSGLLVLVSLLVLVRRASGLLAHLSPSGLD